MTNKTVRGRVEIIQRCLEEDLMPILLKDMPRPWNDKQRASLRTARNLVMGLIVGNRRFLARKSKDAKP